MRWKTCGAMPLVDGTEVRYMIPRSFEVIVAHHVDWGDARASSPRAQSKHPMYYESMEAELLARIARGDMAAFGDLYDRLANTLFSLAMKILRDSSAAEDVLQEVFVQIFQKAHTYDPRLGKPLTWAITLTRNRAIDRLRSVQRGQRLFTPETGEQEAKDTTTPGADDTLIGQEAAQQVRTALAELPPDQREAIEMAFFRGMSQSEISAALGAPLGTVKARIRRGMLKLRQTLDDIL